MDADGEDTGLDGVVLDFGDLSTPDQTNGSQYTAEGSSGGGGGESTHSPCFTSLIDTSPQAAPADNGDAQAETSPPDLMPGLSAAAFQTKGEVVVSTETSGPIPSSGGASSSGAEVIDLGEVDIGIEDDMEIPSESQAMVNFEVTAESAHVIDEPPPAFNQPVVADQLTPAVTEEPTPAADEQTHEPIVTVTVCGGPDSVGDADNQPDMETDTEPVPVQSIALVAEQETDEFDFEQLQMPTIQIQPSTPDGPPRYGMAGAKTDDDDEFGFDLPPISTDTDTSAGRHSPDGATTQRVEQQKVVTPEPGTERAEAEGAEKPNDVVTALVASGLMEREAQSSDAPPSESSKAMLAATDEWDTVQTITPDLLDNDAGTRGQKSVDASSISPIAFPESLEHMKSVNMDQFKSQIRTSVPRRGFSSFKFMLFGTKLSKDLHADRDLVFCTAACPFINDDIVHQRVLQTIFKRLTGSKFDSPRFGGHWEQIGFQGNDPATDMRGVGFLGLMQLLYFVTDAHASPLAFDVYKLSLHETQNFPFCLMGINLSRLCIQSLREDCLNKECNRAHDVFDVLNKFYVGAYLQLYNIWKTQHKTIADTGFVLQELESLAKKNPRAVLKVYETQLELRKQGAKVTQDDEPIKFMDVCDEKSTNVI